MDSFVLSLTSVYLTDLLKIFYLSLSVYISLSLCLSISLCLYIYLCLSVFLSLSVFIYISVFLSFFSIFLSAFIQVLYIWIQYISGLTPFFLFLSFYFLFILHLTFLLFLIDPNLFRSPWRILWGTRSRGGNGRWCQKRPQKRQKVIFGPNYWEFWIPTICTFTKIVTCWWKLSQSHSKNKTTLNCLADALDERARLEEERRLSTIPAWKRQLLDKKGDEAKRKDFEIFVKVEKIISEVIYFSVEDQNVNVVSCCMRPACPGIGWWWVRYLTMVLFMFYKMSVSKQINYRVSHWKVRWLGGYVVKFHF